MVGVVTGSPGLCVTQSLVSVGLAAGSAALLLVL